MSIRECINRVMAEYLHATSEEFKGHPLANFLRGQFRDSVAQESGQQDQFIFKGSAGQGQWNRGPWVAVFDPLVTRSAQTGYYPVYLFREDMQGVYLSLNQGMTEAKRLYKSDAKTALRARAANFRAILGNESFKFPATEIDLTPSAPSNDSAFYESGSICAKFYANGKIPPEAELVGDLREMLNLYAILVLSSLGNDSQNMNEGDEPLGLSYEDGSKFRLHKRIERNSSLARKVKKLHGYTCQVCSMDYEKRYGPIGRQYIEAHHLRPLALLQGQKVAMDPQTDFAVLCANCHRMVHKSGCIDDIEKFKRDHFLE